MGSELTYKLVPYTEDPLLALRRLQEDVTSQFDLPTIISQIVTDAQEEYDAALKNHPNGLDGHYVVDALAHAKKMAERPIPTTPAEKVDFIRALFRYSEEGTATVLDIQGVNYEPEYDLFNAYVCDDPSGEIGVERIPTAEAEDYAEELCYELGRGQSMMVPTYDDPDIDQPTHWLIVTMTLD